jgi:hypothetical protein
MDNSLLKKYRNNNGRIVGKRILTIDVPSLATPRVSCTEKNCRFHTKKNSTRAGPSLLNDFFYFDLFIIIILKMNPAKCFFEIWLF